MNQTIDLLLSRSSCRNFTDDPVPPEVLDTILRAGIQAPTGGNLQPYSIITVKDPETRHRLAELSGRQMFVAKAPVSLLFCIDWHRLRRWAELSDAPFTATSSFRHFWISFQDVIICAQNICTAADALGMGSVYIGTIIQCFPDIRDLFCLPDGVFPVVLLSLGHPAVPPEPQPRLGPEVVVHHERYQDIPDEELAAAFADKCRTTYQPLPERLERLDEVCRRTGGKDLAEACRERVERDGFINPAQRQFGLHYSADIMPRGNERYLEQMKEFGFGWLEPYRQGQ